MTSKERLWLNGFATVSEALAHDRLAIAEVCQALEDELVSERVWMAPWAEGVNAGIRTSFGS